MDLHCDGSRLFVIYIVWRYSDDLKSLEQKLSGLIGKLKPETSSKLLVAIETLLPSKEDWNDIGHNYIRELLTSKIQDIHVKSSVGCVIFGICDDPSGTPALEAIVQCTSLTTPKTAMVVVSQRIDYLGHDPNREPDAGSDVFQALLSSSDPFHWTKEHFPPNNIKLEDTLKQDSHANDKIIAYKGTYGQIIVFIIIVFLAWLIYTLK